MSYVKNGVLLLFCLGLGACASHASPEDVQMSLALSTQGKALLGEDKHEEARDIYLSAISRDDENARAWNGLGVSYDFLGKHDLAQDAYEHARALIPDDMTATNNLAHLYLERGDAAAAARLLKPFIADKKAPAVLKENYARAVALVEGKAFLNNEPYVELGSFTTPGLAEGHIAKLKPLFKGMDDVSFLLVPEVKVANGSPSFSVRAACKNPQNLCKKLNPKISTRVAHPKK